MLGTTGTIFFECTDTLRRVQMYGMQLVWVATHLEVPEMPVSSIHRHPCSSKKDSQRKRKKKGRYDLSSFFPTS